MQSLLGPSVAVDDKARGSETHHALSTCEFVRGGWADIGMPARLEQHSPFYRKAPGHSTVPDIAPYTNCSAKSNTRNHPLSTICDARMRFLVFDVEVQAESGAYHVDQDVAFDSEAVRRLLIEHLLAARPVSVPHTP
eukprot:3458992-Rhodomonas_salina.3